jgi:hypothetical protein
MFEAMPVLASCLFFLIIMSLGTFYSVILLTFYPRLYKELDGILSIDFGVNADIISTLEGEVNIINDWIIENRNIFGPIFLALSLHNLIRLISLMV